MRGIPNKYFIIALQASPLFDTELLLPSTGVDPAARNDSSPNPLPASGESGWKGKKKSASAILKDQPQHSASNPTIIVELVVFSAKILYPLCDNNSDPYPLSPLKVTGYWLFPWIFSK